MAAIEPTGSTGPAGLEITITPTCYRVLALPETDCAAPACTITVEYRAAAGQWVICRFGECLSHDGTWHPEPAGSQRDVAWWSTHGHDLQTALNVARRVLPGLPACVRPDRGPSGRAAPTAVSATPGRGPAHAVLNHARRVG